MKWNDASIHNGMGQVNYTTTLARSTTRNKVTLLARDMIISGHTATSVSTGFADMCLILVLKGKVDVESGTENIRITNRSVLLFPVKPSSEVFIKLLKPHVKILVWGFPRSHFLLPITTTGSSSDLFRISGPVSAGISRFTEQYVNALLFQPHLPAELDHPDVHLSNILATVSGWRMVREDAFFQSRDKKAVHASILFIEHCMPGEFSLKELCIQVNASESTLRRAFIRETGMRLQDHIKQVKLRKSQQLLLQRPALEIKEVAYMLGFSSPSQFSVFIRRNLGVSPGTYRAKNLPPE